MKLSKVWSDVRRTIDLILHVLDNNVTAQENLGPTGAPLGSVLTSVGEAKIPQWLPPTVVAAGPGSTVIGSSGGGVITVAGPPGPAGPPGADGDTLGHWETLAFDGAVLFDSEGDLVVAWVSA